MSSSPKTDYLELRIEGAPMHVSTYREWLIMAYQTAGSGCMMNMRVASLHLIKQVTVPSLHEYVVAHIIAPDTTERYLALERKNGRDLQAPSRSDSSLPISAKTHRRKNESRRDSGDTSVASLDSFSKKPKNAKDVFELLEGPLHEENDKTLLRLVFDKEPFYLFELVNWAVVLHEEEKDYKTFSKNCYWFTGSLVAVLKDRYGLEPQNGDGKQDKKEGKGKRKGKEEEEEKARGKGEGEQLQGTWHHLRTFEAPKTPRPDILPKYSKMLRNFEERVKNTTVSTSKEAPVENEAEERNRKLLEESERKLEVAGNRERQLLAILAMNNIPKPEPPGESDIAECSRSREVSKDL